MLQHSTIVEMGRTD